MLLLKPKKHFSQCIFAPFVKRCEFAPTSRFWFGFRSLLFEFSICFRFRRGPWMLFTIFTRHELFARQFIFIYLFRFPRATLECLAGWSAIWGLGIYGMCSLGFMCRFAGHGQPWSKQRCPVGFLFRPSARVPTVQCTLYHLCNAPNCNCQRQRFLFPFCHSLQLWDVYRVLSCWAVELAVSRLRTHGN